MNILYLCRQKDMGWGQAALARALQRRGAHISCLDDATRLDSDVDTLVAACSERPSLILHPELNFPILPRGLAAIDIPTACLQIDTYAYTERRIRWSMLFDHPIVYHPGYRARFLRAGHPGAVEFFHAADRELFDRAPRERVFDVGAVGRTHARIQTTRRRVLSTLAARFKLNDWQRYYAFEEMAEVYLASKIVVNVLRDDYPQDANMRAFEAMAAGCLLISRIPTELTAAGFEQDVHFVAYRDETEIGDRVAEYLANEAARQRIADMGRQKVLREDTYDCRAEQVLQIIERSDGKFLAPARQWPEEDVRLLYLDYHTANGNLGCAGNELIHISSRNLRATARGGAILARGIVSRARHHLAALASHK
ncbi:MAG: glycosyltransferase [Candidatus Acidiferrales bacterium]